MHMQRKNLDYSFIGIKFGPMFVSSTVQKSCRFMNLWELVDDGLEKSC